MARSGPALRMTARMAPLLAVLGLVAATAPAAAQSEEEWIRLGTRVHGGYGAFIPTGIRIGLDAVQRLQAGPREIAVTFYSGEKAPCACIADGIMVATRTSPGQGTLKVAEETSPAGTLGVAVVTHRATGRTLRYTLPGTTGARLAEINKTVPEPAERHRAVMRATDLFTVEETAGR